MIESMSGHLVTGRVPALCECGVAVLDSGKPCSLGLAAVVILQVEQLQCNLV